MTNEEKRVLFISDLMPSDSLTAGAVLKSMCRTIPESWDLRYLVVGDPGANSNLLNPVEGSTLYFTQKPNVQWSGISSNALVRIGEKIAEFETKNVRKKIQKFIDEFRPEIIFIAPQCQILTKIWLELDVSLSQTVAIMWDYPTWWAESHNLSPKSQAQFVDDWCELFEKSSLRLVPSEKAKNIFQSRPSDSFVLYPFFESDPPVVEESAPRKTLKIVFAGQEYARSEIENFISNLQAHEWTIGGLDLEFHHFGNSSIAATGGGYVQHGRVHQNKLITSLNKMDLAYLPYPKEQSMSVVANTSFPSKLGTYVAANLPVIYDGPEDTGVANFIEENQIGYVQEESDLTETLKMLSRISRFTVRNVYEQFFSETAFSATMSKIIKADVNGFQRGKSQPDKKNHTNTKLRNHLRTWDELLSSETETNLGKVVIWHRKSLSNYYGRIIRMPGPLSHLTAMARKTLISWIRSAFFAFYFSTLKILRNWRDSRQRDLSGRLSKIWLE